MAAKSGGTEKFTSVDVIDDFTVRINLKRLGQHCHRQYGIYDRLDHIANGFQEEWGRLVCNNPVGTGPFQFVSWEKGVKTVYKKFPDYWQKGKPYLDGIEWIPMQDPMTRLLSLKKG